MAGVARIISSTATFSVKSYSTQNVSWFSLNFFPEIFLTLRRIQFAIEKAKDQDI